MSSSNRRLGLLQTTSLVVGNLIGSGVFLLPATLGAFGTLSLFAWGITGTGALFLAGVFAALSRFVSKNGGPHIYVEQAFGKEAAFWVAFGYWILSWISNTALIVAAVSYLSLFVGDLSSGWIFMIEISILGLITLVNIAGIQLAGRFELFMTTLKLIPLVLIPLVGLFSMDLQHFFPIIPHNVDAMQAMKSAMFLTLWAFIGLETATVPSGEVINAKRNVPLATILGTSIALVVYVLGSVAMIGHLGNTISTSHAPYADLAGLIFGGNWATIIALGAFICCLGSFNGWTLVVSRIAQGAANDGLFPAIFSKTDQRGTPVKGLLISSACTLVLLFISLQKELLSQFNAIIDISITLILIIYACCVLAYFKMSLPHTTIKRIFIGLGALLFVIFSLWAAGFKSVLLSLSLLLLGLPLRFYLRKETVVSVSMPFL